MQLTKKFYLNQSNPCERTNYHWFFFRAWERTEHECTHVWGGVYIPWRRRSGVAELAAEPNSMRDPLKANGCSACEGENISKPFNSLLFSRKPPLPLMRRINFGRFDKVSLDFFITYSSDRNTISNTSIPTFL